MSLSWVFLANRFLLFLYLLSFRLWKVFDPFGEEAPFHFLFHICPVFSTTQKMERTKGGQEKVVE